MSHPLILKGEVYVGRVGLLTIRGQKKGAGAQVTHIEYEVDWRLGEGRWKDGEKAKFPEWTDGKNKEGYRKD